MESRGGKGPRQIAKKKGVSEITKALLQMMLFTLVDVHNLYLDMPQRVNHCIR